MGARPQSKLLQGLVPRGFHGSYNARNLRMSLQRQQECVNRSTALTSMKVEEFSHTLQSLFYHYSVTEFLNFYSSIFNVSNFA